MAEKLRKAVRRAKVASKVVGAIKRRPRNGEFVPGTAGKTTSTVDITISCRHLVNLDLLSKSDPLCVVYGRPPGSRRWVQLMRTEIIDDDLNPDFTEKLRMEYCFEKVQQLRFEVYDVDSPNMLKLESQDALGYLETSLAQIVNAGCEGHTATLCGVSCPAGQEDSKIILTAEEIPTEKEEALLRIGGTACGKGLACFPPKTYFILSKLNEANRYIAVYRSALARGLNPSWPQFRLTTQRLCSGDRDKELKIDLFQLPFSGQQVTHLGSALTTLAKLLTIGQEKIPLLSPKGEATPSGLRVFGCTMLPIHTFIEYLHAGLQLQCSFAIDFTASNGEPTDNISLHYTGTIGGQPNVYEQAIYAVGSIIQVYDTDGTFSGYGFGARLPPRGDPSHFFNLTLTNSSKCSTVAGVLEAYRQCMKKTVLCGPTNFAPTINHVAKLASKVKFGEMYYILVIITDGVITDMLKTKKAIVDASAYPMSIIIIGVGEADFDAMEELDGDAVRVSFKGKYCQRDIVQFVAYRSARAWMGATGEQTMKEEEKKDDDGSDKEDEPPEGISLEELSSFDASGATCASSDEEDDYAEELPESKETHEEKFSRLAESTLAKEVLAEIPNQVRSYMVAKGITPAMIPKRAKKPEGAEEGAKEQAEK